jgi:hypothetical protein
MRTALFWVVMQRAVVISCRRCGTTYRSHLEGPRGDRQAVPKRRYEITRSLRNNPEERCCRKLKWSAVLTVKGKGHDKTGHDGPEVECMCRSILSLTLALDGGGWSTPRPGRFTPGKDPIPTVREAGWATGPVWMDAENIASTGFRSPGPSSP